MHQILHSRAVKQVTTIVLLDTAPEQDCKFTPAYFRRVSKAAKRDCQIHVCPSVCPSAWNNSDPTGQIFVTFYVMEGY
jgi:hypothetical protein